MISYVTIYERCDSYRWTHREFFAVPLSSSWPTSLCQYCILIHCAGQEQMHKKIWKHQIFFFRNYLKKEQWNCNMINQSLKNKTPKQNQKKKICVIIICCSYVGGSFLCCFCKPSLMFGIWYVHAECKYISASRKWLWSIKQKANALVHCSRYQVSYQDVLQQKAMHFSHAERYWKVEQGWPFIIYSIM